MGLNKSQYQCKGPRFFFEAQNLPTECRLLITFANRLDPDQARQDVWPDLDPICLTLRWYFLKIFLEKKSAA